MKRTFVLLAIISAGLGLTMLLTGSDQSPLEQGGAFDSAPVAYSGWALGLLMGLTLAWLAAIDWRDWPTRLRAWAKLQRRRLGLAILGGLFAGILLFF
jgi:hypothetical protein